MADAPETSPVDARTLRDTLGWFTTGVTIITTMRDGVVPVGVTANSFNSVSLDPPLVLFSLAAKSFSLDAFKTFGRFAIHVLSAAQGELSNRFAKPTADKFDGVFHVVSDLGCPILPGSLATLECELHAAHEGGDHVIFVGRVLRASRAESGEPLLFSRGKYARLAPPNDPYLEQTAGRILPPLTALDPWVSG